MAHECARVESRCCGYESVPLSQSFKLFGKGQFSSRGNAVHKEETIEVVALVLQAASQEAAAINFQHRAIELRGEPHWLGYCVRSNSPR